MLVYVQTTLTLTKQALSSKILESAFLYFFSYEEKCSEKLTGSFSDVKLKGQQGI